MRRRHLGVFVLLALATACGGSDGTPTQPSRAPATLSPGPSTASLIQGSTAHQYVVTVSVRETGGQTGATLRPLQLQAFRGTELLAETTVVDAWPSTRIAANGSAATRAITLTDDRAVRQIADRVTVLVSHLGDDSSVGSLMFSVDVNAASR